MIFIINNSAQDFGGLGLSVPLLNTPVLRLSFPGQCSPDDRHMMQAVTRFNSQVHVGWGGGGYVVCIYMLPTLLCMSYCPSSMSQSISCVVATFGVSYLHLQDTSMQFSSYI